MSSNALKGTLIESRESGQNFEKRLIIKVVQEVEEGLSRKRACKKYGMTLGTLGRWLDRYGSSTYHQSKRVCVSALKKRIIVCAIEQGTMTVKQACVAYGIKCPSSIYEWLRDAKDEKIDICVDTLPPMDKLPAPVSFPDIKILQQTLEEAQLKIAALNILIDVAEEQLKINIRKKPGAKQLSK